MCPWLAGALGLGLGSYGVYSGGVCRICLRTDRRRMLAVTLQSLAPKSIEKEDFKDDESGSTSVRTPRIEIKRSMLTDVDDSVLVKPLSELEE